jgi:hypothetical protein
MAGTIIVDRIESDASYASSINVAAQVTFSNNMTVTGNTTFNGTGFLKIPSGTTAQRPASPVVGMIRYNTTNSEFEAYSNVSWLALTTQTAGAYAVDYLIVAGGGAGGANLGTGTYASGGGGAGGALYGTFTAPITTAYTLVIGAGGATAGYAGSDSTGLTLTAVGGGSGGPNNGASTRNGGSGGGAADPTASGGQTAGTGTVGQGKDGGAAPGGTGTAGGGGGASAAGSGYQGGAGVNWQSLGTFYAGGGSGGGSGTVTGGAGGGGTGAPFASSTAGTVNTGGGGGGSQGTNGSQAGKLGGSGIIIIRYFGSQKGTGGTVTSAGGYTYHTFTSSGTFTA